MRWSCTGGDTYAAKKHRNFLSIRNPAIVLSFLTFRYSFIAIFRDRKEFAGSLLKQLDETYQLIDWYNKTKATFSGLERIDKRDFPEEAVREALLNSIVHRDYFFTGSTLINLYDDRIEFVSLGGLVPGLSMEAILIGVSQSRNPNLAAIFYRMRLIESYGTGIGNICRLYNEDIRKPRFDTAKGVFLVVLPNRNEISTQQTELRERDTVKAANNIIKDPKEAIYQMAKQFGSIKRKDAEELLNLKSTRVFYLLKELCDEGKLQRVDKGRNSRYRPFQQKRDF